VATYSKKSNNARPGEDEMITFMKRKRDIMDYDPIQMIAGAGVVFMMISSNGRITKINPERCWIGGVIKCKHEALLPFIAHLLSQYVV